MEDISENMNGIIDTDLCTVKRDITPKDINYFVMKNGSLPNGIANLLKVLTRTMQGRHLSINKIAMVQKDICEQFGINLIDEFLEEEKIITEVDSIDMFLSRKIEFTNSRLDRMSRKSLYKAYEKYCFEHDLLCVSRNELYKYVRRIAEDIKSHGERYFAGVKFKKSESEE